MPKTSRKAPLAPVVTTFKDILAVVHWTAELRSDLAKATSAPNVTRRTWAFQQFWRDHAEAQKRLDGITAPGLRRRVAELQRQLDAVYFDATAAALHESHRERSGDVVDMAAARARRSAVAR